MNESTPILLSIFSVLVFLNLLTLWIASMLSEWWVRKLLARTQRRMGPSYVGPLGILQPFADFLKLLLVKTEPNYKYGSVMLARIFGCIGIGALATSLFLLPVSPVRIAFNFDIILLIYFLGVLVAVSELLMFTSLTNPFTIKGVSRYSSILALAEPAFFTATIVPVYLASLIARKEPVFSISTTIETVWGLWFNPLTAIPMLLATIAALISIQSKLMFPPFNIPEAEQELIAGVETEFSGPLLALFNFLHDADLYVLSLVVTFLFLGGPHPFSENLVLGVLTTISKYLVVLTTITILKSSFGRFRIEQGISSVIKYALVPALVALILSVVVVGFI
ncbi:MAG: complex I subunit 1 family protein [Desulfurococcaceae archaeon TW002]